MNIKVMYHSSTGNTTKIAYAIADTLNVKAEPIGDALVSSTPIDLLFIGDGIYFGKANKKTVSFINQLDPDIVKNVAVFATYGGQDAIGDKMQQLLRDRGLNVVGQPFTCKGQSWVIRNRKHPSQEELSSAREFAKAVLAEVERNERFLLRHQ